ncbi:MAG: DUF2851 family protein [Paludibacter sp.]|nr:DUF2851 family protein [Paludibacter sp.]
MNVPEILLHYVWQNKLFYVNNLTTIDGSNVEVINVGVPNTDAGPDFFNAKIIIDDTLWAGNVEIHSHASDWKKHNHSTDKAYDNVILHVVADADLEIFRTNGTKIPQMVLKFPDEILQNYTQLLSEKNIILCEKKIKQVPEIIINSWKTALLVERLQQKTTAIFDILFQNKNNWDDAFYAILARNFGFGTNSEPFELLAKSLPQNILAKHKNDIMQIEAMLFGQANLLPDKSAENYVIELKKEYKFLSQKYNLKPIDSSLWKLLRLRPDNFPHVRIAQFAALITQSSRLFSKIVEISDINILRKMFVCKPSKFWETHYRFENESPMKYKQLSRQSVDILLINTVVSMLFAYAQKRKNSKMEDVAISILEQLPPEKNAIVEHWRVLGIETANAADTQSLLQLRKHYCDKRKCLHCRIGHKIVAKYTL